MLERKVLFWQLLQTDNDMIFGCIGPRPGGHKIGSSAFILGVVENAQCRPLDIDSVASFDELLGD